MFVNTTAMIRRSARFMLIRPARVNLYLKNTRRSCSITAAMLSIIFSLPRPTLKVPLVNCNSSEIEGCKKNYQNDHCRHRIRKILHVEVQRPPEKICSISEGVELRESRDGAGHEGDRIECGAQPNDESVQGAHDNVEAVPGAKPDRKCDTQSGYAECETVQCYEGCRYS